MTEGPKPTVDGAKLRGRLDQLWGWAKSGKTHAPDGGEYYLMDVENVDGPDGFTEFVFRRLRECGIEVTGINGNEPHPSVAPVLGEALIDFEEVDMHPVEQAIRDYVTGDPDICDSAIAVLAVLDLHTPRLRPGRKYEHDPIHYDCDHCYSLGEGGHTMSAYPCETIGQIADALGVTP